MLRPTMRPRRKGLRFRFYGLGLRTMQSDA